MTLFMTCPFAHFVGNKRTSSKQQQQHYNDVIGHHPKTIAWAELLASQGGDLWSLRDKALHHGSSEPPCWSEIDKEGPLMEKNHNGTTKDTEKKEPECLVVTKDKNNDGAVHLRVDPKRPGHLKVRVYCNVHDFQHAEKTLGMDKFQAPTPPAQALTQAVGDEWIRQRRIMRDPHKGPLRNVKEESLRAAASVRVFCDFQAYASSTMAKEKDRTQRGLGWIRRRRRITSNEPPNVSFKVDLKDMVMEAVGEWAIQLFNGKEDPVLFEQFLTYWGMLRQRIQPHSADLARAKTDLIATMEAQQTRWNTDEHANNGGLFQAFFESDFASRGEVVQNILHAMIAASDATNCLLFWTLWNLVQEREDIERNNPIMMNQGSLWEQCQEEVQSETAVTDGPTGSPLLDHDLEQLGRLKQMATHGEPVNQVLSSLSCMGSALVETLRVFPPVWTLPRAWEGDDAISAKLDVPTANGVRDYRDWNPWENILMHQPSMTDKQEQSQENDDVNQPMDDNNNNVKSSNVQDYTIASFGVGKRSCPAGTAALWATRYLLHQFVQFVPTLEECQPGHALQHAYLGPTLATDGPQWFLVTCRSDAILETETDETLSSS